MNETKTNWDSVVSNDDLSKARRLRSKTYLERKYRRIALPELISEGWEEYKSYKNEKIVGVRKSKILMNFLRIVFGVCLPPLVLRT